MAGSRTRVALLLFLTFAAGAAAGVAADRLSLLPGTARAEEEVARADAGDRGRDGRETTIERFADDLGLTAAQRERIEGILEDFRSDLKAMRREFHPRWHALIDTTRTRIEAVLTPEQVSEYRALLEAERKVRRRDGDETGSKDGDGKKDRAADGAKEGR